MLLDELAIKGLQESWKQGWSKAETPVSVDPGNSENADQLDFSSFSDTDRDNLFMA